MAMNRDKLWSGKYVLCLCTGLTQILMAVVAGIAVVCLAFTAGSEAVEKALIAIITGAFTLGSNIATNYFNKRSQDTTKG